MNVGELFAGIGGFGLAAQRVGARVAWASEIEPFASAVYERRFPHVGRVGDVTVWRPSAASCVDCITAGFPCQDVSVAGKRKGLAGERTGLFWEIVRVARRLRPRWLLLENVPGLLSSHRGRDFESVIAALDELGYGVAWRVLDAQFFGVPQRRRRVFLVGHLGGPCPAEVLFEPEGVSRDTPKGREAGQGIAYCLGARSADGRNERGDNSANLQLVAKPVGAHHRRDDLDNDTYVIQDARSVREKIQHGIGVSHGGPMYTLDGVSQHAIAHALRAEGADASEDGTGRGTPLTLDILNQNVVGVRPRRLTPRECERLQGFPDDWTLIDGASDSARYRVLGNAVAVPVVEWILRRIVLAGRSGA